MTVSLSSLPAHYRAVVFGATGGIGAAMVAHLNADPRCGAVFAASRSGASVDGAPGLSFDLDHPDSIDAAMAAAASEGPLHLAIAATGALHSEGHMEPEKSWRQLSHDRFMDAFRINTVLPSLILQAALGRLAKGEKAAPEKAIVAALSARVGSISDNRLGGWHSYRASKAALNQVIRTCSIELARKSPGALCVGLHPGTVDTDLSKPFQRGVPKGKLFTPAYSAERLVSVLDGLGPDDSGRLFDWAGEEIEP
jgi:NAD(P)-dependent dehydrogenase (short-subunit alcohol dehydrogenase family)